MESQKTKFTSWSSHIFYVDYATKNLRSKFESRLDLGPSWSPSTLLTLFASLTTECKGQKCLTSLSPRTLTFRTWSSLNITFMKKMWKIKIKTSWRLILGLNQSLFSQKAKRSQVIPPWLKNSSLKVLQENCLSPVRLNFNPFKRVLMNFLTLKKIRSINKFQEEAQQLIFNLITHQKCQIWGLCADCLPGN